MSRPLLLLALLLPGAALADPAELPARVADLSGARAQGMGDAFRAIGSGNEAIFLNPAAIESQPRYQLDASGLLDLGRPQGSFGASILDSTEGPVGGGVAFTRFYSGPAGSRTVANVFHLALAVPLGPNVALGASGKWLHLEDLGRANAVTPDLGLLVHLELLSVALVAYNLVDIHSLQTPRQFAAAVVVGPDASWKAALDVVADTASHPDPSFAFHLGGEYSPLSYLAVRAGYVEDRIRGDRLLTAGMGVFFPPGIGLDLAYRHQLGGELPARVLALNIKLQPFTPEPPDQFAE